MAQIKNTHDRYGLMAITLHWLLALAIIGLFASGLWMRSLDYYSSWYVTAPFYHISIGILLVLLTVWRLIWRIANVQPSLSTLSKRERLIAYIVHWSLYLMVFLLGLTGYIISTADGQALSWFGLVKLPAIPVGSTWGIFSGDMHEYISYVIMGLTALHTLAALKHHILDKDSTLLRILPFTSPNSRNRHED